MTKKIKQLLAGALLVPAMVFGISLFTQAEPAQAVNLDMRQGSDAAQGTNQRGDAASLFGTDGEGGIFRTIVDVMLFLIGAISVIMLIIGGIRYVVSGGDSTAVQNAKNTILYAIVGIVVAILSYAVVRFVIDSFAGQ